MASSGPNYCGTATGVTFDTQPWSSTSSAQGSTNFLGLTTGATCATTSGHPDGDYLYLTNFGFAIPAGATINGIFAEVMAKASGANVSLIVYQLLIANTPSGTNFAATPISVPTSATSLNQGSSSTLWGLTPTVAQVNASGFGVVIQPEQTTLSRTTTIYGARITITYTAAAGPTIRAKMASGGNMTYAGIKSGGVL